MQKKLRAVKKSLRDTAVDPFVVQTAPGFVIDQSYVEFVELVELMRAVPESDLNVTTYKALAERLLEVSPLALQTIEKILSRHTEVSRNVSDTEDILRALSARHRLAMFRRHGPQARRRAALQKHAHVDKLIDDVLEKSGGTIPRNKVIAREVEKRQDPNNAHKSPMLSPAQIMSRIKTRVRR